MNNQNIFYPKIKHRSIETSSKEMYHIPNVSKKIILRDRQGSSYRDLFDAHVSYS